MGMLTELLDQLIIRAGVFLLSMFYVALGLWLLKIVYDIVMWIL